MKNFSHKATKDHKDARKGKKELAVMRRMKEKVSKIIFKAAKFSLSYDFLGYPVYPVYRCKIKKDLTWFV